MSKNDSKQIYAIFVETPPKKSAVTTNLIINQKHMEAKSSPARFKLESSECQQELSSPNKTSKIFHRDAIRDSLWDLTNISAPLVQSRPAALRFPSKSSSAYSNYLQFTSSLHLGNPDRNRPSKIGRTTPNRRCSSISNGSGSFDDHIKTKQMRCQSLHRHLAFNKLRRLKNMLNTSGRSSLGKLYNLFPITRRSDTIIEHSAIEKCRGDEDDFENLEDEFSFREHLQSTSRNVSISSSLPLTSTPKSLDSRYQKRSMPDNVDITGSAKKVKEDEKMEGNDNDSIGENLEETMDVEMTESSLKNQRTGSEDEGKSRTESDDEDISLPSALFNRSHPTSFLEASDSNESELPSHLDVKYELDIVKCPDILSTAFASISAETLANLLKSMTMEEFSEKFVLIDCRYPFEFIGGHIRGAYNLFDPTKVEAVFYPDNIHLRAQIMKKKPIFYCEFSQKRGPSMANELRALDRKFNFERYPAVDYPEMYLLEYGYRNFYLRFSSERGLLEPNGYVAMNDAAHIEELKNYKYHRIRTVASVYHTLARDRYNRQRMEMISPTEVDVDMTSPTQPVIPMRLIASSPESPSQFPSTPKCRPKRDRVRYTPERSPVWDRESDTPRMRPSSCRRLFFDVDSRRNEQDPGPSRNFL